MIISFSHKGLKLFAERGDRSKLNADHAPRIRRILAALDHATSPREMAFPGWRFHELTGDRAGVYAVTVNKNWRITFIFVGQDAADVDLEDYH